MAKIQAHWWESYGVMNMYSVVGICQFRKVCQTSQLKEGSNSVVMNTNSANVCVISNFRRSVMKSALFWDATQRIVVPYRRPGTTHQSRLQGSRNLLGSQAFPQSNLPLIFHEWKFVWVVPKNLNSSTLSKDFFCRYVAVLSYILISRHDHVLSYLSIYF